MRALVVDDSRAMRLILKQILRELQFEVFEAAHGLEALERLKQTGCVDLALVDWNMPEMKGIDLVTEVRKLSDYSAMKIMMVTTETEMEQVQRALSAGADEYVMKPFTKDVILEKLGVLGLSAP
ncbi:MAG: response regulator [Planctomycetes bacterium]|nr:response regulator [Planctomycetota bacterium]